jgi:hypothetical protein
MATILIGSRRSRSVGCVRARTPSTSTENLTFAVGLAAADFVLTSTLVDGMVQAWVDQKRRKSYILRIFKSFLR